MNTLVEALSALSLIHWVAIVVAWLLSHAIVYVLFLRWVFRRQWNLYRNLKRPIILLKPIDANGELIPGGDLSMVHDLLRANDFLNVAKSIIDYRSFDPAAKHCIVVLGYKPGLAGLNDLLNRVKVYQVPLIVFTYGDNRAVSGEDQLLFDSYPYILPANFPLTLLNQIFATAASFPYDRREN